MKEPSLGLIEFKSIAQGFLAADAVVKKAPVRLLTANPICPGKYLITFAGEVADVEESLQAGVNAGADMVINQLFLPHLHDSVIPAIAGVKAVKKYGALGIVESFSVASCVLAADKAAKVSPIELVEIRLANGIGGKAYFVLTGDLDQVEASTFAARDMIKEEGLLAGCTIIPAPHKDFLERV